MTTTQQVLDLAVLRAGRKPSWTERIVDNTAGAAAPLEAKPSPGTTTGVVPLQGAVVGYIKVQCRADPNSKSADVQITGADFAETYTITINALAHTDAGAGLTEEAVLAEIAGIINAGAQAGNVTAGAVVGAGPAAKLTITGDIEADFTIAVSTSGGAATMSLVADATFADVEVYLSAKEIPAPKRWAFQTNSDLSVDTRNRDTRFFPAGFDDAFVRVVDTDGRVTIGIGPAILE